ncbi:uncharacterized protein K452DRAFT_231551 [Aplosporella prunicola CBS 121167]|uniref:Nuclear pore complex protein Nup85 n=1 Tax=Aplosporella prunicola CBS 121167 TaxID=1176127 RepID=A0A6A6BBE3_9PEZI|nr:uncharacterized protein K452DRAFT_231551 [Aplosporella prunicola CBS 121167]KAF2139801.1 hypothetical protein K452DRAFT_231551 [Aplosporella prunicola CBS 121167]
MEDFGGKPASRKSSRPVSPTKSVRDKHARASSVGSPVRSPAKSRLGVNHHTYDIGGIAKSIATTIRPVNTLRENDKLILQTERILNALGESDATEEALSAACRELGKLWNHPHKPVTDIVGPAESDSPLAKVDFVTSLLLQLHHPPPLTAEKNALTLSSRGQRSAFSSSFGRPTATGREIPMPKVLLDWLASHHDPSAPDFELFKNMGGNYSSRPGYWDTIFASVMRGSFEDALTFLKGGNFSVAESALEDGYPIPGYSGTQLVNVNRAVNQAIEVLESCPAYNNDDWDVKGSDWMLFRRTVASTIEDLRIFSEGEGQRTDDYFNASASQGDVYSFSTASRRAVSQVPWAVYENLQILYDLLLGKPEEILQTSFDWLEAVICMTAWWDGEDEEDAPQNSFAMARRTLRSRTADATPKQAYRQRLGASLAKILAEDDPGLTINTNNPVEVALACVMEENMEGLVNILRCWSMMATTAVVEVASTGGWLGDTSKDLMKGFDQSDLMVLSFGQGHKQGIAKDDLLEQYAELLFGKTQVQGSEGWELAIQVLGRLDHADTAKDRISQLLDRLSLSSAERVDKILDVCNSLGLVEHANIIAERYATSLAENSYNYGSALFYYARAHNSKKIRHVLDLLISLCLIHSMAYPPKADLDDRLRSLIDKPKQTLSQLSRTDLDAAHLLSMYLSGYATLRKFYDLRDEEVNSAEGKVAHRPVERKRQAAAALVAVVNSAADSIRGGLYDPSADAIVQVDGLLTLLGETLPFVNQPKRLLSLVNLATLSQAVEDLQTAPSLVYAQCEEHLQATLGQVHGGGAAPTASSSALLKKSVSSSFSMIGGSTTEGSGVLVDRSEGALDAKRGWDWRRGVQGGAKGRDVCGVLRLGIAREVGRAWAEGAEW